MPVLLILGATSDMGMAIAEEFAAKGYDLLLAAREVQRLVPLQSDLEIRFSRKCHLCSFDAMNFGSHNTFYQTLPLQPDAAICVFGYMEDNEATAADNAETVRTIGTNFTGAVSILNVIAADFSRRKTGTIAGISSVAGERGRQSNYIYGAAKAGFTAYLSGLRNRMFQDQVHVLTVLPGFVYTRMTAHLTLPALLTATPAEVARAISRAMEKKKNRLYVKWYWKWIMLIIRLIPEPLFKRLKL